MRRSVGLLAVATALASAFPAAASLQPVRRTTGEVAIPRVRAGVIHPSPAHRAGRVRVIVGLRLPPLAAAARRLSALNADGKLDISTRASQRYIARVDAVQRRAIAQIRGAIPQARIEERFQVVLDGITVDLPYTKLAALVRLGSVAKVYPSVRYTLLTNRSPSVIGADELQAATGARGDGVKIGVVDDGVDPTNPFLNANGYTYPAGFPRGGRKWTTPKVIVARVFPGPGAGRPGRLAVDRHASFHGTHVAGIAAGDAGTCSPGGEDHPPTCGLSGVAPRAYLGNYRVFTVPTPAGHTANTPEIVDAFEFAVRDGMNVINFSGGGPETEPANDAMIDTVRNVVDAGVVPVIAAGNDRDSFGLGTVGTPGTAPDAITVAAVSNTHVFDPTLSVSAADATPDVKNIPVATDAGLLFPTSFALQAHLLVDIGTLTTRDGQPLDRRLCGPDDDPNNPAKTPLLSGSLRGAIALVSRGHCTFISKALRAADAGAAGILIVDNRAGEAEPLPVVFPIPGGKISDLDGARLRTYLATHGGAAPIVIGNVIQQVETGRSGIITSFSSAGPTDFSDLLKPDLSAPGGQVLSSTLPEFTGGSPFAVFDGTSMATPHVAGAAALLVELHPSWTPQEIKSALMSTAGPAWGDTARTQEAPVLLEGSGLVNVARAATPDVFTDPASLSFQKLDVTHAPASRALVVRVADAGGGAGTWSVQLDAQNATPGASLSLPGTVDVAPGGEGELVAVAHAAEGAPSGQDYGLIVLRRGDATRRIPYAFDVSHPALADVTAVPLKKLQLGDTRTGPNRVSEYCCPSEPFGPPPDYVGAPMDESGSETLYVTSVKRPLVNLGASILTESNGALVDPWLLGSKDERDVQGYAGTPVNQNDLMFDFSLDIGAAGAEFPLQKNFYVSVDSGRDPFTLKSLPGGYLLRSWQNDLTPPRVHFLTVRVAAGRPTIVARIRDSQSGVDPLSLTIGYRKILVGAALYDPSTGLALFPLPIAAKRIPSGKTRVTLQASDYQESKNLDQTGKELMPNTTFKTVTLNGVPGPAVTWLEPEAGQCLRGKNAGLAVVASSTKKVLSVRFLVDGTQIGVDRRGASDFFSFPWHIGGATPGPHTLTALATDAGGRRLSANRVVRVCK